MGHKRRECRPQSDECKLERVVSLCGRMHLFGKKKKQPEASTSDTASTIAKMKEQKSLMEKKRELHEVRTAINAALKATGGVHAGYSCHFVSWDDVKRGTNDDGSLSCWGANITDTRLCAKDGRQLFTVRSDNWNEKLGTVDASDVALITGNAHGGKTVLAPVTLRDFLRRIGDHGEYVGLSPKQSLCDEDLDAKVSIRFQTTFLPISEADGDAIEFATSAYSYATRDANDPKNLVVLASSQGIALQQDQVGNAMIYHHQVGDDGKISRHWLEAEKSRHAVGQQQVESEHERQDALKRGKATSCVIGPKCVGTRFNALLTVQIPLQQRVSAQRRGPDLWTVEEQCMQALCIPASCSYDDDDDDVYYCEEMAMDEEEDIDEIRCEVNLANKLKEIQCMSLECDSEVRCRSMKRGGSSSAVGEANAARVSVGSRVAKDAGSHKLRVTEADSQQTLVRHPSEHVTITVIFYYTVKGGVPSKEDVVRAIDDLESMYRATNAARLADSTMDYMKGPLSQTAMVHAPGEAKLKIFELQGTLDFPVDGPTEEPVMVMLEKGEAAAASAGMTDEERELAEHEASMG